MKIIKYVKKSPLNFFDGGIVSKIEATLPILMATLIRCIRYEVDRFSFVASEILVPIFLIGSKPLVPIILTLNIASQ